MYQPLDANLRATAAGSGDGAGARRGRQACSTQGRTFNSVVAGVICINAVLIGLETDAGLLGLNSPRWAPLEGDLARLGASPAERDGLVDELRDGVQTDARIKTSLRKGLNETMNQDVDLLETPLLKSGAYTSWEYIFVVFFMLELCLRMRDQGAKSYCMDSWRTLDVSVVVLGILDLGLPYAVGPEPSALALWGFSVLRATRALRILRLIRVCHELKVLGTAYAKAFSAVLWVSIFIFILDFVIAVLLTTLIAPKAHLWGEAADDVEGWFGSIGSSMQTLFAIMTLSEWIHLAQVMSEVIPSVVVVPAIVLYILMCSFATLSLLLGVISDAFLASQREGDRRSAQRAQRQRVAFASTFTSILSSSRQNRNGYLSRDGFKSVLEGNSSLFAKLRGLDVHTNIDELMQLFDRLCQDSDSDVAVEIDSLVEAVTMLSGPAKASGVFDLKYLVLALRREAAERAAKLQIEAVARHDEHAAALASTATRVSRVQHDVILAKDSLSEVRPEVAALHGELERLRRYVEQERIEHQAALEAMHAKIEMLAAQVAAQSALPERLDDLSAKIAAQAAAAEGKDTVAAQFAAKFAARFAAQFAAQYAAAGAEAANEALLHVQTDGANWADFSGLPPPSGSEGTDAKQAQSGAGKSPAAAEAEVSAARLPAEPAEPAEQPSGHAGPAEAKSARQADPATECQQPESQGADTTDSADGSPGASGTAGPALAGAHSAEHGGGPLPEHAAGEQPLSAPPESMAGPSA